MNATLTIATTLAGMLAASFASAEPVAVSETVAVPEQSEGVHNAYRPDRPGVEMGAFAGVGYGVGVGARLGGTVQSGVYLGGAFTYFPGNAAFFGDEIGYKFWPGYRWQLRPYLFAGAAFLSDEKFGRRTDQSGIVFAFQPGFLTSYHFGAIFLSAEGRAYVSPVPGALAFLGGAGVNL